MHIWLATSPTIDNGFFTLVGKPRRYSKGIKLEKNIKINSKLENLMCLSSQKEI